MEKIQSAIAKARAERARLSADRYAALAHRRVCTCAPESRRRCRGLGGNSRRDAERPPDGAQPHRRLRRRKGRDRNRHAAHPGAAADARERMASAGDHVALGGLRQEHGSAQPRHQPGTPTRICACFCSSSTCGGPRWRKCWVSAATSALRRCWKVPKSSNRTWCDIGDNLAISTNPGAIRNPAELLNGPHVTTVLADIEARL